ncbi:hypothetical protein G4O51_01075 [Candidatus Bathyarchaeota archaeon A05DMB-2]|jgi:sugar-specific transcriptional regulator TrmB|nr:hypothetical protein [Candidatus Bathyarchaeota archaeon A05DMB-2]
MSQNDEYTQTLTDLGLTLLQAKIYLSLANLGKANVQTISKASKVARQDIYRIMPTLQKLGLAEKIITTPTLYEGTPLKEGLSILLRNRKEEYAKLQKKTTSLINKSPANIGKIDLQHEEDSQFKITSERTLFLKMHKSLHQKAQMSIDSIIPLIPASPKLVDSCSNFKRAIKRDVKIQLILQKTEKLMLRELQALEKNPLFKLKYLAPPIPFGMHIFDKKEVTLSVSEKNGLPSLWSNNPNLVKLAANYFDEMWNKAEDNPN